MIDAPYIFRADTASLSVSLQTTGSGWQSSAALMSPHNHCTGIKKLGEEEQDSVSASTVRRASQTRCEPFCLLTTWSAVSLSVVIHTLSSYGCVYMLFICCEVINGSLKQTFDSSCISSSQEIHHSRRQIKYSKDKMWYLAKMVRPAPMICLRNSTIISMKRIKLYHITYHTFPLQQAIFYLSPQRLLLVLQFSLCFVTFEYWKQIERKC